MSLYDTQFWRLVDAMFLLESSYAQRWLTLLSRSPRGIIENCSIEAIRTLMLIEEDEYKQKSDLIKRVVYEPLDEVNLKTSYGLGYTYMYGKRKPIVGFNFMLTQKKLKTKSLGESFGPEHADNIREKYGIPPGEYAMMLQHPLIVAAVFQANAKIVSGNVLIEKSRHFYILKVIDNSWEYLSPILNETPNY